MNIYMIDGKLEIKTQEEYEAVERLLVQLADAAQKYEKDNGLLEDKHEEYLNNLSKDDRDIVADLFTVLDEIQIRLASNWNIKRSKDAFEAMCKIRSNLRELMKNCGDYLGEKYHHE